MDFCPESLFGLGMLQTHLTRTLLENNQNKSNVSTSERHLRMRINFKYQHQNVLRFLMTFILKCHNQSPVSLSILKKIQKVRKSLVRNGKHKYLVFKNFQGRNFCVGILENR